jgi:hypothetical protein
MAAPVIQFKRGAFANLPGLQAGEPALTTDTFELYVGIDSTTNGNKFFGSHRYWTRETTTTGSGVNFVEGTNNGTDFITIKAPGTLAGIVTFTLPGADGSNGQILTTNGSGTLSFSSPAASSFTIAGGTGTDTFNTGGTLTFAGTANEIETVVTDDQVQIGLPDNVIITGVITATNGFSGNLTGNVTGNINSSGVSTVTSLVATNINASGIITATNGFVGNVTGTASSTTNIPNLTGDITSVNTVTSIAAGVIVDADINASAGIVDTKLATISTANKVSNSATTATDANTASAIVARDASGNFSAGTITASLTGTASSTTNIPNLTGAITSVNTTTSLGSFSSADLSSALTDETGSGAAVFATSPTLVTPVLGAATGTSLNVSGITTTGTLTFSATPGIGITGISSSTSLTENSHTFLPTQAAVKAYVDAVDVTLGIDADAGGASTVATSQTLTISGTANEVNTSVSGQTITVGLPDSVTVTTALTTPTVNATNLKANDGTTAITITNSTGAVATNSDLTVGGNLYVNGSTTQVNSTALTVEDRTIDLGIVNGAAPAGTTTWDLGVLFNYNSSGAKKSAVIWEHGDARFKFASVLSADTDGTDVDTPQLTVTTFAPVEIGQLWVTDCAGTSQVISCTGSTRNLENITIDAGTF